MINTCGDYSSNLQEFTKRYLLKRPCRVLTEEALYGTYASCPVRYLQKRPCTVLTEVALYGTYRSGHVRYLRKRPCTVLTKVALYYNYESGTNGRGPVESDGEIVLPPRVEPLTDHHLLTEDPLLSCLLRDQFRVDHLTGDLLRAVGTAVNKEYSVLYR